MTDEPKCTKTILCLANSRRPGGRCVAGKEFTSGNAGAWVRPVNPGNGDAISEADLQYKNGELADVLDIVSIPMIGARPHGHQNENEQIDPRYHWVKESRATWAQIVAATDDLKGALWLNGDSSYHGTNDKVAQEKAKALKNSLVLIRPARLSLIVGEESQYGGGSRRRVRASIDFNDQHYNFVVTDPWIEDKYFAGKDGTFKIDESRLCISLSEIIGGTAIKLVAAVITPDRVD